MHPATCTGCATLLSPLSLLSRTQRRDVGRQHLVGCCGPARMHSVQAAASSPHWRQPGESCQLCFNRVRLILVGQAMGVVKKNFFFLASFAAPSCAPGFVWRLARPQGFLREGTKRVEDSLGSHWQIPLAFKHKCSLKTWGKKEMLPALNHKGAAHWHLCCHCICSICPARVGSLAPAPWVPAVAPGVCPGLGCCTNRVMVMALIPSSSDQLLLFLLQRCF